MKTINVEYIEIDVDGASPLGKETHEEISAVLLPSISTAHPTFFVKQFSGDPHRRWEVIHIYAIPPQNGNPAIFQVYLLRRIPQTAELYFARSKKQPGACKLLRKGTLVEIDYGHFPRLGLDLGTISDNDGYNDTRQVGEMHKRRLAVVVKMVPGAVQVVPITSQQPYSGDKTLFEIGHGTLARLVFYGRSGKRSWAVCSMIETVSFTRVLPPESFFGRGQVGRSINYVIALATGEINSLDEALLHAIGVTDYTSTKNQLAQLWMDNQAIPGLQGQLVTLQAQLQTQADAKSEFDVLRQVAENLARRAGVPLDREIADQIAFNELEQAEHGLLDRT